MSLNFTNFSEHLTTPDKCPVIFPMFLIFSNLPHKPWKYQYDKTERVDKRRKMEKTKERKEVNVEMLILEQKEQY